MSGTFLALLACCILVNQRAGAFSFGALTAEVKKESSGISERLSALPTKGKEDCSGNYRGVYCRMLGMDVERCEGGRTKRALNPLSGGDEARLFQHGLFGQPLIPGFTFDCTRFFTTCTDGLRFYVLGHDPFRWLFWQIEFYAGQQNWRISEPQLMNAADGRLPSEIIPSKENATICIEKSPDNLSWKNEAYRLQFW